MNNATDHKTTTNETAGNTVEEGSLAYWANVDNWGNSLRTAKEDETGIEYIGTIVWILDDETAGCADAILGNGIGTVVSGQSRGRC